jgi:hypothetical protein
MNRFELSNYVISKNYTKEEIKNILQKIDKKIEFLQKQFNYKYDKIEITNAIIQNEKTLIIKMFFIIYLSNLLSLNQEDLKDVI